MYIHISLLYFVCSLLQNFPLFILYYFPRVPQLVMMPGSECGEYQMEGEGELRRKQNSFSLVRASVKWDNIQYLEVWDDSSRGRGQDWDGSVCMNRMFLLFGRPQ